MYEDYAQYRRFRDGPAPARSRASGADHVGARRDRAPAPVPRSEGERQSPAAADLRERWSPRGRVRPRRALPRDGGALMFAVDTNVLVYAADRDSPFHEACHRRLSEWRVQSGAWYTTWGVLYEFLRICTHPRVL